jgi:4-oxalocrotonate tautomerase
MPHIIVKLWPGRSEEQKFQLTDKIVKVVMEDLNIEEKSVSVAFEEVLRENWAKEVFQPDIVEKEKTLYKRPGYKL